MIKNKIMNINANILNKNININKSLFISLLYCGMIIEMLFMAGFEEVKNG